jgi:Sigma-70, region 4
MSRLDELPPDQRATLSLLLRQRKSYAEVAVLLGIPEIAVHDRAHAALAVLAPRQARALAPERRREIADYLLGQQAGIAERLKTRTYLGATEPARAWAQALAQELAGLGAAELPDIPPATDAGGDSARPIRESIADLSATSGSPTPSAAVPGSPAQSGPASSRLGGALLLVAIVVAVVVAVILLSGGGGSHAKGKATPTSSATTPGTTKTTAGPTVSAQLPIKSPDPKSRSIGVVEILSENGKRAFYIAAEHLPASRHFFYAIWLYNSHTSSVPLSKAPNVGSDHKLAGGALLPSNAGSYREILLTRETSTHPTHPGAVVLRGPFKLSS